MSEPHAYVLGSKSDISRLRRVLIAAEAATSVNAIINPELAQTRLNELREALDEVQGKP